MFSVNQYNPATLGQLLSALPLGQLLSALPLGQLLSALPLGQLLSALPRPLIGALARVLWR